MARFAFGEATSDAWLAAPLSGLGRKPVGRDVGAAVPTPPTRSVGAAHPRVARQRTSTLLCRRHLGVRRASPLCPSWLRCALLGSPTVSPSERNSACNPPRALSYSRVQIPPLAEHDTRPSRLDEPQHLANSGPCALGPRRYPAGEPAGFQQFPQTTPCAIIASATLTKPATLAPLT